VSIPSGIIAKIQMNSMVARVVLPACSGQKARVRTNEVTARCLLPHSTTAVFRAGRRPLVSQRRNTRHVVRCTASDEELERAIKEAQEILGQAAAIAQKQTRFELELANMTDKADKAKKEDAKEEEWTRKDKEDRYEQLLSYWCSAGLHETRASRLAKRMVKQRSTYARDLQLLQAKVERLERTLPDVDVPDVLAKQPSLLMTEIPTVVGACMVLSQIFDPSLLPSIINSAPQLLVCKQLQNRVNETFEAVKYLFPKASEADIIEAVAEEPMLIMRLSDMDRSWPTTGISELPIDAANALVFAMREMYN